MIDLGRAFRAPFEDKDWVSKTLLGFLWSILIVTAPAVTGAEIEYIRSVSRGDETLPGWSDFGNKWVEGFMVLLAGLIYFLPVVVLAFVFLLPAVISGVAADGNASGAMAGLFAGGTCLFILVAVIYSIAVSVLFAAALTNYAMRGSFGAFFDFGGIMALVRGGTGYFTAWLYTIAIAFAGSLVTSVIASTGVGAILSGAVTYLVAIMTGHVLGQWARQAFGVSFAQPVAPAYAPAVPAPPAPPAAPTPPAPPAPPAATAPPAPPAPPVESPADNPQAE